MTEREWTLAASARLVVTTAERLGGDVLRVEAEDTYRILRAAIPTHLPERIPDFAETLGAATNARPSMLGTIQFHPSRGSGSAWIEAIVYDFDRDPPCDRGIVARTLDRILVLATDLGFTTVALPLDFGCLHGGIARDEWLAIVIAALRRSSSDPNRPVARCITLTTSPPAIVSGIREVEAFLIGNDVSSS